jgi:hypothetical protein
MSNGLVLDLTQYGDAESRAIAELAAHKNELGSGWTFIKHRRALAEFRQYLKADRVFKRILRPRQHWSHPY